MTWDQVAITIAVLAGWLILRRWVLPRFGVPT